MYLHRRKERTIELRDVNKRDVGTVVISVRLLKLYRGGMVCQIDSVVH